MAMNWAVRADVDISLQTYLRDLSARLADRYEGDCIGQAEAVARRLLEAGEHPWIGSIRDVRDEYHAPLIPLRYAGRGGPAWNVHYVACAGTDAYDPLVGEVMPAVWLAETLFGRPLEVVKAVGETELGQLLAEGGLRAHMASLRWR